MGRFRIISSTTYPSLLSFTEHLVIIFPSNMVRQRRVKSKPATLPLDIWTQILTRLPSKSLLKCRCVSKLWCSLIDDSYFVSTHIKNSQNNKRKSSLIVLEPPTMSSSEQLCTIRSSETFRKINKFKIDAVWFEFYQVVGYINGLLCMKKFVLNDLAYKIFLWNPSLKKALELPPPKMSYVGLKFNIDCSFGFDYVRNDYKVVASLYGNDFPNPRFVEIFTLSTFSWKSVNIGKAPCFWVNGGPKAFLNGFTFWLGFNHLKATQKGEFTHFVSFDVHTEVFTYIELPDYDLANGWDHVRFPVILDQAIALLEIFRPDHVQIWVVEGPQSMVQSWTKKFKFNLQSIFKCLYFKEDGEILFATGKVGVNSYNIKSQEGKTLAKTYKLNPIFTSVYIESLVLLKEAPRGTLFTFPP